VTSYTIKLNTLHPKQQIVADSAARFVVLGCGRRFGKTELATDKITNALLERPKPYFYVVPTYSDLLSVWDAFDNVLHDLTTDSSKSERRKRFITNAELWFFSFDAIDRMRGKAFAGGACDESAAAANLEYGWTRVIMPTLADYHGWCMFVSSFKGKNYFFRLYNKAIDPLEVDWAGFSFTTADNPHIDPAEIDLARRTLPQQAFEEEYLAVPNDDYGAVFRGVLDCISEPPEFAADVVLGIDWGRSNDYTVIVALDRTTCKMVDMDRFNQIDWQLQRGRVKAMADKWRARTILAESNSIGEPNIEALRDMGLCVDSFATTPASKPGLIDALALAIENKEIGILDDPVLISELQAYEMERLPGGSFRYSAPEGGHDDTVIGLALAWHCVVSRTPLEVSVTSWR
jgi:hypothetical protein